VTRIRVSMATLLALVAVNVKAQPFVIVAHPSLTANTLSELIALTKIRIYSLPYMIQPFKRKFVPSAWFP
jgi:hypothetical protein